jgi:hypothetical protein
MQPYLLQFLLMTIAGWLSRKQQDAIKYLKEENRVLREQLGGRRIRFSIDQRCPPAREVQNRRWRSLSRTSWRDAPILLP